ncbi:hypothetical protein ABIF73_000840 [Bradyrhizobium japonicum]|uniref:hypothetical protein n=1 Tax=Bradyrhizobium japonicum TaxID=375 RepID=UPI00339606A2
MLQIFSNGDLDHHARVEFTLDASREPKHIHQTLVTGSGAVAEMRTFDAASFVFEIHDPFWITESDVIFLNSEFEYDEATMEWLVAAAAKRVNVSPQIRETSTATLIGMGFRLPPAALSAFNHGRPIWRRSALSGKAGIGENASNTELSSRLYGSMYAWLVWAKLLARRSIQLDRERDGSPFAQFRKGSLSALADRTLGHALGHWDGTEGDWRANDGQSKADDLYEIGIPHLGVQQIELEAFHYDSALKDSDKRGDLSRHFGLTGKGLNRLLSGDLRRFQASKGSFDEVYDPIALVEWAGRILITLRVALTASRLMDAERAELKAALLAANGEGERMSVSNRLIGVQWSGLRATRSDGSHTRIGLHQILDLQWTVFLAFATDVDPRTLNPGLPHLVLSSTRPAEELVSGLLYAARWLGRLFRSRYLQMDIQDAYGLVNFANPESPPSELEDDDIEMWLIATRMLNSFMTSAGRTRLYAGARAVLEDGKTRSAFTTVPAYRQTVNPQAARTWDRLRAVLGESESALKLPAPIFVEAGYLILPGNWGTDWFNACDPFEPEDGIRAK